MTKSQLRQLITEALDEMLQAMEEG